MHKAKNINLIFPFALILMETTIYLSNDMYLAALPTMAIDFVASQDQIQYTLTSWIVGSGLWQLICGPVADRYGRRVVALMGGILFCISTIIAGITDSLTVMLIARFFQGSSVGAVVVAGYASIHELFDTIEAIKIIAFMGAITVLAPALGPMLGAIVLQIASWNAIFYILAILGLISLVIMFKVMPETNPQTIPINIKAIYADYKNIINNKVFLKYTLPYSLFILAIVAWIVESPFIVMGTYGKSELYFGFVQIIVFSFSMLGANVTKYLIDWKSTEYIILLGIIIAVVAAISLMIISIYSKNLPLFVALMSIFSFGMSLIFAPLNRQAIEASDFAMGKVMAVFSTFISMSAALGSYLVTLINDKTMNNLSILLVISAILALLFFIYFSKKDN